MDDKEFERQEEIRIESESRDNDRWVLNNALQFWRACPNKRCRRARSCVGDAARCHEIFWPVVPEEVKAWWRAIFDAKKTGRTLTQARRAANTVLAHLRRSESRRVQTQRAQAKSDAPPVTPATPRDYGPRVRSI